MRFINDLPVLNDPMPVANSGTDISISYYIFNKYATQDNPDQDTERCLAYGYEVVYAYRQLLKFTNIEACGRVRIFLERRCEGIVKPYLERIGLGELITLIDLPLGVQLSGYIPCLDHPDVAECRYRFHSDADLWWFSWDNTEEKFDLKAMCDWLDDAGDDDTLYGQPIQKPEWVYQINLGQHAEPTTIQAEAERTLKSIFGPRTPVEFHKIASVDHNALKEQNNLSELRCFGGWFVGARKDSSALWEMQKLYETENHLLSDDEGLYAVLFHKFPHLKQHKVLQGEGEAMPDEIQHASLGNFQTMNGIGVINVGTQPFYEPHYDAERKKIASYFNEVGATTNHATTPGGTMNVFGKHIVGTEALNQVGNVFPLISQIDQPHGAFLGFPAAFSPWTAPLPTATKEDPEIVAFYCLSYHPNHATHDMHVYAKAMVYAYKQLIQHTNILDCGRVYFFIDKRCLPVVWQYVKQPSLKELVVTFESDKMIHYAAYIQFFYHEYMKNSRYRLYTDVDMWWINLENEPKYDLLKMMDEMDTQNSSFFANDVPKTKDMYFQDLYGRCVYEGDSHVDALKDGWGDLLPKDNIRGITGCQMAVRNDTEFLERLEKFYLDMNHLIRDDEAFWATFLTQNPDIELTKLTDYIQGMGFDEANREKHNKPELAHVGTYMFEHFFNNPYAHECYNHCREYNGKS